MNSPVDGIVFNPLSAEPKKPQDGLTVMADGVNWDPLTLATGDALQGLLLRWCVAPGRIDMATIDHQAWLDALQASSGQHQRLRL